MPSCICHLSNQFSIYFLKRAKKLAFTSFQIIFKVNTEIITNDEDICATKKIISFYQAFDNHTEINQSDT